MCKKVVIRVSFNDRVYEIVAKIPYGRVMSYGQIASWAGSMRASRAAGYAMYRCPHKDMPCHRVVHRDGTLAPDWTFNGSGRQRKLLEDEGVTFTEDGRVDMQKHRFRREEYEEMCERESTSQKKRSPDGHDQKHKPHHPL